MGKPENNFPYDSADGAGPIPVKISIAVIKIPLAIPVPDSMPKSSCTTCGNPMERISRAYGEHLLPAPGDFTICTNCGEMYQFKTDLGIELVNLEELDLPGVIEDALRSGQASIRERGRFR